MVLVGLVGKPNVGKSTFFSAATLIPVEIANYPFTTIEPNEGVAYVRVLDPGPEFGVQSNPRTGFIMGKWRFVPIKLIDVAGLVPGAHEGRGLGNQFLDNLRQADVLIHVIDISGSTDAEGRWVGPGNYDPLKDIEWFENELNYWFYQVLERNWEKIKRKAMDPRHDIKDEICRILSGLQIRESIVKSVLDQFEDPLKWDRDDLFEFAKRVRELGKPMLIAANKIDLPHAEDNYKRLIEAYPNLVAVPTSAEAELALKRAQKAGLIEYIPGEGEFKIIGNLNEKQKKALEYIKENVLEKWGSTGVQIALDKAVFEVGGFIAVFPGGVHKLADKEGRILPDCFLMPKGSTVIEFAEKIHSDLAKNFIKAIDVRTKRVLGKDYVLKHRDVIEIVAR